MFTSEQIKFIHYNIQLISTLKSTVLAHAERNGATNCSLLEVINRQESVRTVNFSAQKDIFSLTHDDHENMVLIHGKTTYVCDDLVKALAKLYTLIN